MLEPNTTTLEHIAPTVKKRGANLAIIHADPKRATEIRRKGGLNKRGKRHSATVEREKALELAKDIIAGRTIGLINAQTLAAYGTIRVMRVDYEYFGKKKVAKRPEIVSDDEEIASAIHWHYHDGPDPNDEDKYYFVEVKEPNVLAAEKLLDRTFGRATETKKITLDVEVDDEVEEMAFGAVMGFMKVKKSK